MKKYIGVKIVQAEPCDAWDDRGTYKKGDPGYKVVYNDGYTAWSPKEVFEKAYQENSEADENLIGKIFYFCKHTGAERPEQEEPKR